MVGKKLEIAAVESPLMTILNLHMTLHMEITSLAQTLLLGSAFIIGFFGPNLLSRSLAEFKPLVGIAYFAFFAGAVVCFIYTLLTIRPVISSGAKINPFYYASFVNKMSPEEYGKLLQEKISDDGNLIQLFAEEIHSLGKYVLEPAYKKLKYATEIFIISSAVGFAALLLTLIMP